MKQSHERALAAELFDGRQVVIPARHLLLAKSSFAVRSIMGCKVDRQPSYSGSVTTEMSSISWDVMRYGMPSNVTVSSSNSIVETVASSDI